MEFDENNWCNNGAKAVNGSDNDLGANSIIC